MQRFKWNWGRTGWLNQNHTYRKYTPLITDECNLGCTYCFQRYKTKGKVITPEILETFLDKVFTIEVPKQRHKDVFVQFCGGEALLYPELVDFGMTIIKEKYLPTLDRYITLNVLSNGTTIGDPVVRKVLQKHPELGISVSIDGDCETHNKYRGGFETIVENFGWLKEHYGKYGKQPRVAMTISPDSVDTLAKGFKYLVTELGIPEIWVSLTMEDKRWAEDEYAEKLFAQLIDIVDFMMLPENVYDVWTNLFDAKQFLPSPGFVPVCSAITGQLACTPDGILYPCYVHRNPKVKHDFSIGNVWNWVDPTKFGTICKCTIENTKGLEDCVNCPIGIGCKRCSAAFAENYGTMLEADTRFCKAHHAKFWALDYLIQRRREFCGQ